MSKKIKKIAPWNDKSIRWVCEEHPTEEQEHKIGLFKRCGGAGMPDPKTHDNMGKKLSTNI